MGSSRPFYGAKLRRTPGLSGGPPEAALQLAKKHVRWAVRSEPMIMYEASPSAYPSGMLVVEKHG